MFNTITVRKSIKSHAPAPVNIALNLFDSLVASVLNYACEIWGFLNAECVERIHMKFCKYILNIKQANNNYALYFELRGYPFKNKDGLEL